MSDHSNKPIVLGPPSLEESQAGDPRDRRTGVRVPFTADAEVRESASQACVNGRCSDIGLGGCYVDTLSAFAIGAAVRVRIEHEGSKFEAAAVVTYSHVAMGMGMAFTEIQPDDRKVLRRWIVKLGGEIPPEPSPPGGKPGVTEAAEEPGEEENLRLALSELISLLVRKGVLSEQQGVHLLR
jgi:hypothetical protein